MPAAPQQSLASTSATAPQPAAAGLPHPHGYAHHTHHAHHAHPGHRGHAHVWAAAAAAVADAHKPFACHRCNRLYSHKSNLMRHLRLECGVRPRFACHWCDKHFKHRHHLRDHQRTHLP